MHGQFALYSDPKFVEPFLFPAAKHGDIVYLKGTVTPSASPSNPGPSKLLASSSKDQAPDVQKDDVQKDDAQKDDSQKTDSQKNDAEKDDGEWRPRCRHGPRGMCEHCMPKEDKRARYHAEIAKWKGRGMSVAVMEALEALKFKIAPQETAHITAASVDTAAANEFQAYIARTGFSQQRVGICYGNTEDGETKVQVIYEPPQRGDEDVYRLVEGEEAGDMTERADAMAALLGMRRVGVVLSARPRKCILSGMDVVFALDMAKDLTDEQRKAFVVLVVSLAESGKTLFEAYQLSDLAMEIHQTGIFDELNKQKPNSGKVLCNEDVLVEGKDTRKAHTEFFLLNIPIKTCESLLSTNFPVENRQLTPQGPTELKRIIGRQDMPYHKRLADFHLLLFLSNMFDMDSDMPGLVADVKDGGEIGEGFRLMIDGMASS